MRWSFRFAIIVVLQATMAAHAARACDIRIENQTNLKVDFLIYSISGDFLLGPKIRTVIFEKRVANVPLSTNNCKAQIRLSVRILNDPQRIEHEWLSQREDFNSPVTHLITNSRLFDQ